jgi:hypothetical protein
MTRSAWLASAAVIALSLVVTSRADIATDDNDLLLPLGSIVLAADGAPAAGQTEESAEDSAKMGKESGTHEGSDLGATPESDTNKVDQPARRNPTTGDSSGGTQH